jgi:hypothetical protein
MLSTTLIVYFAETFKFYIFLLLISRLIHRRNSLKQNFKYYSDLIQLTFGLFL